MPTVPRTKANLLPVSAWLVRQNNQDLGQVMGVDFKGSQVIVVRKDGFVEIPSSISGIGIEDEGISLGEFQTIDFRGAGVTATDAGAGVARVTIPGAASVGADGILQASDGAGGFKATSLQEVAGELISGNNAQSWVLDANCRTYNPAPAQVRLAAAITGEVNLLDVLDGFVYTLDVRVGVNDGVNFAAWRVVAIVFGTGGAAVVESSTATSDGPGAGAFTAPSVIAAGATIQLQVTNPDATARRWGVEASIQVLAQP